MPAAAFFDLDKTILSRSSALAFAGPLYRARLIGRRDVVRSAYAQLSLVTGRIDHVAMERIRHQLSLTVRGWDTVVLRGVIEEQLAAIVTPLVFAEARQLITAHQRAGEAVVIVTSTGTDMAQPIGAMLGADDVLATRMREVDGRYTGAIEDYMYGPRKAEAIRAYTVSHDLDLNACSAYSDSVTDLPMLSVVGRPHAVNPDRALRRLATERGWPVHDFGRLGRRTTTPIGPARVGIGAAVLGFAAAMLTLAVLRARRARR